MTACVGLTPALLTLSSSPGQILAFYSSVLRSQDWSVPSARNVSLWE